MINFIFIELNVPILKSWLKSFQRNLSTLYLNENNIAAILSHKSHHSILLVLSFSVLILPIMAFSSWLSGDIQRCLILLGVLVICSIILIFEKQNKQIKYVKELLVFTIFFLSLYLLASGALQDTGALWCYPLSIILFIFYGAKIGLKLNFLFIIFSIAIFTFNPLQILTATYSDIEKTRFLFTFFLLNLFSFVITFSEELLVKSLNKTRESLQKASLTDELTGLGNRRFIKEALENIDRRYDSNNSLVVVMMIDIDKFKSINDTYGHHIGDISLVHVGQRVKEKIRKTDLVARWGGEEFLVVLTNTEKQKAIDIAKDICKHVESSPHTFDNLVIETTVSIGLASFEGESKNIEQVIKLADDNLYKAKDNGRNNVVY